MVDEPDWDERLRRACNPFLLVGGEGVKRPQALYAVLDQASLVGLAGRQGLQRLVFSATDAVRFDQLWPEFEVPVSRGDFAGLYRALPIFLLEVELSPDGVRKLLSRGPSTLDSGDQVAPEIAFTPDDVGAGLEDLEGRWKKIVLAEGQQPGAGAELYDNLFGEAVSVAIARVEDASAESAARLDRLDPLDGRSDATEQAIEAALAGAKNIDHIVVLDVGQGGANGLVCSGDIVAYVDFGGGVTSHKSSFPSALTQFCFCAGNVPIILSHWDHDHWSSEGRDTRAHRKTWIAPRQAGTWSKKKACFHNSALITSITTHGTLLLWPASTVSLSAGQVTIWKCTGSSRNASGLAVTITAPNGDPALAPVLLPADAGYADLPAGAPGTYDAIGCPHHGGYTAAGTIPLAPSATYPRLIYSYGQPNSYGHAFATTRQDHDAQGWLDPSLPSAHAPSKVRQTKDRSPGSHLGHIGFDWGGGLAPGPSGCTGGCPVGVEQV